MNLNLMNEETLLLMKLIIYLLVLKTKMKGNDNSAPYIIAHLFTRTENRKYGLHYCRGGGEGGKKLSDSLASQIPNQAGMRGEMVEKERGDGGE